MTNAILLLSFAFLINIPCGFIRSKYPKFSLSWLFSVHASVPFIIYLRYSFNAPDTLIPLSILCAIAGQITGRKLAESAALQKFSRINILKLLETRIPQGEQS